MPEIPPRTPDWELNLARLMAQAREQGEGWTSSGWRVWFREVDLAWKRKRAREDIDPGGQY